MSLFLIVEYIVQNQVFMTTKPAPAKLPLKCMFECMKSPGCVGVNVGAQGDQCQVVENTDNEPDYFIEP